MKFNFLKSSLSLVLCAVLMSSCVSSKKHKDALAAKEALEQELAKSREATQRNLDQLSADLRSRDQKLRDLEKALEEKDRAVRALMASVNSALAEFKNQGLTVEIKNGKVYVSLPEKLLFRTGSTVVDPRGRQALQKLSDVLTAKGDINVLVEGHTDDVPVAGGTARFQDNWDLSVLRATEITRIMLSMGVSPDKVTPSGRSKYVPAAQGTTANARQQNRRTEIILSPDLSEVLKILERN
jgi:chemotaxis protein MotB